MMAVALLLYLSLLLLLGLSVRKFFTAQRTKSSQAHICCWFRDTIIGRSCIIMQEGRSISQTNGLFARREHARSAQILTNLSRLSWMGYGVTLGALPTYPLVWLTGVDKGHLPAVRGIFLFLIGIFQRSFSVVYRFFAKNCNKSYQTALHSKFVWSTFFVEILKQGRIFHDSFLNTVCAAYSQRAV